jgi:hypothetical protein
MRGFRVIANKWMSQEPVRSTRSEGFVMYRETRHVPPSEWRSNVRISIRSRIFRRYDLTRYGSIIGSYWTAPAWMFKPIYGASTLNARNWIISMRNLVENDFCDRTQPYKQDSTSIDGNFAVTVTVTQHVEDGVLKAYQVETNWGEVLWTKSLEDVIWAGAEALYTGTMNEWNGRVRYNEEEEPVAIDSDVERETAEADGRAQEWPTERSPGSVYDDLIDRIPNLTDPASQRPAVHRPITTTFGDTEWTTHAFRTTIQGDFMDNADPPTIFGYPVRQTERIFEPPRTPRGRQNFDGVVRNYMAMSEEERSAAVREQRAPHITMSDRQSIMQTFQRIVDEETLRALRRPQPANPPLPPPTTANESPDTDSFTEILNRYLRRRTR